MLSIITVFSSDRASQLLQQETYMVRYEDWRNSERIIILDGDEIPPSIKANVIKKYKVTNGATSAISTPQ